MNKTNKLNNITKKLSPKSKVRKGKRAKKKARRELKVDGRSAIAASVLALALAIIPLAVRYTSKGDTGDPVPEGRYRYCLDISHHNGGRIEWDSLLVITNRSGRTCSEIGEASDAVRPSFIFIKATEGANFTDRRFRKNWEEAGERAWLRRGAYHFYRSGTDPVKQAEHFLKTTGTLSHGDLPPMLDVETMGPGCTKAELNEGVRLWLETVSAATGRTPIIYTPDSYANDILSSEITGKYPVWAAHYRVKQPKFGNWKMWQFTDNAIVHGIKGKADLSVVSPRFNP